MNIIITMGGLGLRFRKAGYTVPKYEIEVKEKTLFEWSMSSLKNFFDNPFIFIVRREDQAVDFINLNCEKLGICNKVIELEKLTKGQAETAMLAEKFWEIDEPILIYNIDTYVEPGQLSPEKIRGDGFIPCFFAEGTHWSFVKLNEFGSAVEVSEKIRISDNCSIGAYYFKSARLFSKLYQEFYSVNKELKEQYIAPIYNLLIKKGGNVQIQNIDPKFVHVLGTPEELKIFSDIGRI